MKVFAIFLSLIALFFGIGRFIHAPNHITAAPHLSSGTALSEPRALPEFELIDSNNKVFSHKQLYDTWSFLFFGYSQCPGICPATLGKLDEMATLLGPGHNAQFVFITINPEADTSVELKKYLSQKQFKHADFLGATGQRQDIQKLASTLGLFVAESNIAVNGHIDHSGTILVISPDGKLAAVLTNTNNAQAMARDFKSLVHHYSLRT